MAAEHVVFGNVLKKAVTPAMENGVDILRFMRKTIRIMRNFSPLLSSLFNATMQAVLNATLPHPEKEWYLSHLAAHLGVTPSSLQRPLARLTRAGILRRRTDGNRVYYRPHPACPILPELAALLAKTTGTAEPPRATPAPQPRKTHPPPEPIKSRTDDAAWLL